MNLDHKILTNKWLSILQDIYNEGHKYDNYIEALNFHYSLDPFNDYFMSDRSNIFDKEKAKAIYNWYKKHNSKDHSIEKYFDEYKHCTDDTHLDFNSNYGIYAYSEYGLDKCAERLAKDNMSRQAVFCINNNEAMSDRSIDKLCTNTIHFFIRDNRLIMIVNMRASNFVTLLPYDSFIFCFWYFYVFNKLYNEYHIKTLERDYIYITASTIHFYLENTYKINIHDKDHTLYGLFDDYKDKDFINKFEKKLNIS